MSEQETITALAKSVNDLDASRRVGWAKSFEAEEKVNEMQREVESLRYQRDLFRKVASYMDGYLRAQSEILGNGTTPETLARYMAGMTEYLEDAASRVGRSDAKKAMENWTGITEVQIQRAALKREQKAAGRAGQRAYRDAIGELAQQYWFPDVATMRRYLNLYRDHTKRKRSADTPLAHSSDTTL